MNTSNKIIVFSSHHCATFRGLVLELLKTELTAASWSSKLTSCGRIVFTGENNGIAHVHNIFLDRLVLATISIASSVYKNDMSIIFSSIKLF